MPSGKEWGTPVQSEELGNEWSGVWFSIMPAAAIFDQNLSACEKVVLAAMAVRAVRTDEQKYDRFAYFAQLTLATRLGLSRQTVNKAIGNLIAAGYVEITSQSWRRGGGKGPNTYRITGYERLQARDAR